MLEATGGMTASVGFFAITASGCTDGSGGDADAVTNGTSEFADANPEVALTSIATGAAGGTTVTSYATTPPSGPDAIVFFRNQMPYTVTERRAEQVYGALHGGNDNLLKKPVLIADSQDALETICQAFGSIRGEGVIEKLELYEKLLAELSL